MVPRRSADNALGQFFFADGFDLVICAPDFKGTHFLTVFAFQKTVQAYFSESCDACQQGVSRVISYILSIAFSTPAAVGIPALCCDMSICLFSFPVQQTYEVLAFLSIAEGLAEIATEFDAVVPLAGFGNAAACEFDNYVHRLAAGDVAGQECSDTV